MKSSTFTLVGASGHNSCGNLALVCSPALGFTVIEGGAKQIDRISRSNSASRSDNSCLLHKKFMTALAFFSFVFVVASLAVSVALFDSHHASQVQASLAQQTQQTIYVQTGDSLWAIAESHPVQGVSTQELVRWIYSTNGLESSMLHVGQALLVPMS